jgi:cbb3-type cytochrome oxidase subunit 3
MSDFEYWRQFAASWGSLYFAAIFFVVLIAALLPSRKRAYDEAALIPLKDD